ncbi:hypothetical protein N0V88_004424 [Collariella sp. IMI 366227]|nr:hypothetical protein N0V88_004424 [Collariella sp. IMI 366227]
MGRGIRLGCGWKAEFGGGEEGEELEKQRQTKPPRALGTGQQGREQGDADDAHPHSCVSVPATIPVQGAVRKIAPLAEVMNDHSP